MAFPKLYRENVGAGAVGIFAADTGAEGTATTYSDAPDNYSSLVRPAPAAAYLSLRYGTGTFSRTYSGFKPNGTVRGFFHFYHDNAGLNGQSVQVSNSTSGNSATVTPLAGIAIIQPLVCQANGSGSVTFTIAAGSSYWLLNCFELFDVNLTRQIVCEGDSRVDSYGVGSLDTFPAKLAALLGANYYRAGVELIYSPTNKINVINIGAGNTTSLESYNDISSQIDPLYDSGIQNNIVLHTGGNDEGHGLTQTQTLTNYHNYKNNVEAKGWNFYACTVSDGNAITSTLLPKMHELNADIRSTVPPNRVIDLALSALLNDFANLTYFQSDGIHYSAAGNQIQAQMAEHILSPPPPPPDSRWTKLQLVPRANLAAWHALDLATSGEEVPDFGDYYRPLKCPSNAPVLQPNIINGLPALYFDGTKDPLKYSGDLTIKHLFIVAAFKDAAFSTNEGLLTDLSVNPLLVGGGSGTTEFFDLTTVPILNYTYRKFDVSFNADEQSAPMSLKCAVLEMIFPDGIALDGIQIGQDRLNTTRKWKGYFVENLMYSAVKNACERMNIYRYLALKFNLWRRKADNVNVFPFPFSRSTQYTETDLAEVSEAEGQRGRDRVIRYLDDAPLGSYDFRFEIRRTVELNAARVFCREHRLHLPFWVEDREREMERKIVRNSPEVGDQPSGVQLQNYGFSGKDY